MYLQVLDEIISGNWHVPTEALASELTSIAFAVDLGEDMPDNADGIVEEGLLEYIPMGWRDAHPLKEWAQIVLKKRNELVSVGVDELEMLFVKIASTELPTYGSTVFYCRRQHAGSDFILFVDFRGLRVMTLKTREVIINLPFKLMRKFNGTSRMLTIDVTTESQPTVLFTSQAKEIASLMLDYTTLLSLVPEAHMDAANQLAAAKANKTVSSLSNAPLASPRNSTKSTSTAHQSLSSKKTQDIIPPPPSHVSDGLSIPKLQMKPSVQNSTAQASAALLGGAKKKVF
jgi:hypothetical protein